MYKILVFLFVLNSLLINAQTNRVNISGKIVDKETNMPLEYASISFKNIQDNNITDVTISDSKGEFSIKIPLGYYDIKIEYISYKTKEIKNKNIDSNLNLGNITLELNLENLEAVEINTEKTTVEIALDKKIYNVGKDLTISGGTVSDVLDNVPSVSVDSDGSISLRGNNNVQILIDGKPSGLVGVDPSEILNQLPADSIEKVEVITSPSARYDAEGAAGIINIILKKSKIQGLNGSVTTNLGYPYIAGISTNINYRTKDVNIFNTTSYNYRERIGRWYNNVDYFDDTPDLDEKRRWTDISNGIVTNTGIEWYVTEKASITNSFLFHDNSIETESLNTIEKTYELTNSKETILRASPRFNKRDAFQYAFNYTNKFNDKGHKFNVDFQYGSSSQDKETFVSVNNLDLEEAYRDISNRDILVQSDYILPVGKQSRFEAGYRGTFNTSTTDFEVFLLDSNSGNLILDNRYSGDFNFEQNITAFYSQFGSKINSFSFLLGLRYEGTKTILKQSKTNYYDNELIPGLFPTLNLNYEINDKQSLSLGYNRRIRRPRGFMLNPFPSRSSLTDVFQGDPGLNPTFTSAIELGFLHTTDKFTLSTAAYYSNSNEVITFASYSTDEFINIKTGESIEDINDPLIPNEDKSSIVERSPVNINKEERYGFELNLNYTPVKIWRINSDFNIYKFERFGSYQGIDLSANDFSWRARLSNKLTLPYKINWQTNCIYTGPKQDAQNLRKGRLRLNVAFSKDLFKDKATISFNVTDVFNSAYQSYINTEQFRAYREIQFRGGRIYNLSFTYRFNQKKKRERSGNDHGGDIDI